MNYKISPRREGDVEAIYSLPMKAKEFLGWQVKRDVDEMMISAWKWQQKLIDMGINTTKL